MMHTQRNGAKGNFRVKRCRARQPLGISAMLEIILSPMTVRMGARATPATAQDAHVAALVLIDTTDLLTGPDPLGYDHAPTWRQAPPLKWRSTDAPKSPVYNLAAISHVVTMGVGA
jgi:hypothetical protein